MKIRTAKARNSLVAILFIAMLFVFANNTISVYADSPNVTAHSKAEIVQRLRTNSASINEAHTFEITPTRPDTPGALSYASKQSALKMLNNIRYVAGLPDVMLDSTYGDKSQAAAFVLASVGQGLSHAPKDDYSKPNGMSDNIWNLGHEGAGSSNLSAGRGTLNATVLGWMDDGDKSNVDRVGHRRWAINPKMGKVGFGAAYNSESSYGNYYAEYSFDNSGSGTQTNVAWPAQIMPIEFFGNNIPWSLSTGRYISNVSEVVVTLNRRASSPSGSGSWTFKGSESYTAAGSGKYFNINNQGFGQIGCIIFRPDIVNYRVGDIFDVNITGVGSSPITYSVEFISGYPVETMTFDNQEYRLTSSYQTITPTITPSSAKGYEVSYSSSDESVVSVNSNGQLTKVGMGEATITATIDGRFTFSGNPITSSYVVKVPKSLSNNDIKVEYNDTVYYSGKTADIGLVIKDGNKTLVEGTDYTLSIPDNAVKPRMSGNTYYNYTATITGIGNYGDTLYKHFWIYKKSLYNCNVVLSPGTVEYTGTKQTPTVSVYNGDVPLTEGVDYDVTSNDGGTSVGSYSVRISACSNSDCYIGSTSETFTITQKNITESMIDAISSVTYNGSAQTPNVTLRDGARILTKNTDYTVQYSANTNAGTAKATVTGKGNYKGSVEKQFTINPKSLNTATLTLTPASIKYNGALQKPEVNVKDGNITLNVGQDYTLTNSGGTNVGDYDVTAAGCGNYTGEICNTFTITPANLNEATITLDQDEFAYDGQAHKPTVTVNYGGNPLTIGDDYSLSWSNQSSVNAGTYTVTISAADNSNFTGSVEKTYEITPKTVTADMLELGNSEFTYNGTEQKPNVSVKDNGTPLDSEDYEVSYSGGADAGTYTVTLTGKRNYDGSTGKTFEIKPKSIENAEIEDIQSVEYNGSAHTPSLTVKVDDKVIDADNYTVNYDANTNAGTAKATANGIGNYTGSISKNFTITPKTVTKEMVGAIGPVAYDGEAKEPDVIVTDGNKTLEKEKDYAVEYSNNTEVGTAKATVKGKGNYTGSIDCEFEIVSPEMAELQALIDELEDAKAGETDEEFIAAIDEAIEEAIAAVNGTNMDSEYLNSIISSVKSKRTAAVSALEEKKEAARVAAEEAAKAAEKAKRAKQSGQGGAVGKGASMEFAEKSILASTSEEGPKGSKYAPLQLRSTKQANTSVTLAWYKVKGAKKYIIYGNACGKKNKMKKLATSTGKLNYVVKKLANKKALKKGTYHKFMIVALDSKNNVISTSKVVHVATKGNKKMANPTKITLKAPKTLRKGKTHKLAAKQVGKYVKKHRVLAYETSNAKVATVSKGVIKATGKGTCYVYVYAQNGLFKKVKVTVK
ncbi:MAG: Ig-like domain-containing protein [Mogibacterium sp.]|nr:Ig-like domain-containing protein [Mogibacterium sp.]